MYYGINNYISPLRVTFNPYTLLGHSLKRMTGPLGPQLPKIVKVILNMCVSYKHIILAWNFQITVNTWVSFKVIPKPLTFHKSKVHWPAIFYYLLQTKFKSIEGCSTYLRIWTIPYNKIWWQRTNEKNIITSCLSAIPTFNSNKSHHIHTANKKHWSIANISHLLIWSWYIRDFRLFGYTACIHIDSQRNTNFFFHWAQKKG